MDISTLTSEEISRDVTGDHCVEKNPKQPSFREKIKDEAYRNKMIHSSCICASFLALGINAGQLGPTLLDLQILTDTDLDEASTFFTSAAAGCISGSIACGILYGKINADLLMFFSILAAGVVAFITPFCTYFELMLVLRFFAGFSSGLLDTCGNTLLINLWGTEGEGLMQFLHFCFAFGGVLSPLFSEPFLAPKITDLDSQPNGLVANTSYSNITTTSLPEVPRDTNVKYAFFISAALCVFFSIPFLPLYMKSRSRLEKKKVEGNRNQRKLPRPVMVFTLFMICAFFWIYCCVEDGFASFLMTFLVKEYDSVSKSKGAFTTAVYWGSFATARFVMVFLCRIFSSLQLLIICISLMVVSFTAFFICSLLGIVNALIGFAALAGVGMSAVYPAAYSWTEAELLKVTGYISAVFQVSATLAFVVNPLILGHLMEGFSNMWFSYLLFGETIILAVLILVLQVYAHAYLKKRFGPCVPLQSLELDVAAHDSFLEDNLEKVDEKC